MRMIDHESPPEGEHSATCKVGEVGECVTRTVRQVDHDLLEQCVPIVRRNVARHQFVPWKCQLLFVCVQPNQPLTFGKVEDKDFWRALPVRTREGSRLARVDHPQSAKRIDLRSGCSADTLKSSHLNCIHILESIAVSLHVHPQGGERMEERGSRQKKVRRRNGDPGQGCHHTVLHLLK